MEDLAAAIRPGGRLYLHEFAVEFPVPNVPRQVTGEEVRDRFTPERGWHLLALRSGEFLSRVAPVPATLACIERVGIAGDRPHEPPAGTSPPWHEPEIP